MGWQLWTIIRRFITKTDKAGIFYAESWALTHMLYLGQRYRGNFNKFVMAISSGASMQDACKQALGVQMWDVELDLRNYLKSNQLYAALFDVKLDKSAEKP
jgi:hypothetical protein